MLLALLAAALLASCQDTREPNYQYMPNMYESVGYDTYQKVEWLPGGSAALLPAQVGSRVVVCITGPDGGPQEKLVWQLAR